MSLIFIGMRAKSSITVWVGSTTRINKMWAVSVVPASVCTCGSTLSASAEPSSGTTIRRYMGASLLAPQAAGGVVTIHPGTAKSMNVPAFKGVAVRAGFESMTSLDTQCGHGVTSWLEMIILFLVRNLMTPFAVGNISRKRSELLEKSCQIAGIGVCGRRWDRGIVPDSGLADGPKRPKNSLVLG